MARKHFPTCLPYADEMMVLACLNEALDLRAERGPSPWLDVEIERLTRVLDEMRADQEAAS